MPEQLAEPSGSVYFSRTELQAAELFSRLQGNVDHKHSPELHATALLSTGQGYNKDMGGLLQQDGRDIMLFLAGNQASHLDVQALQGSQRLGRSLHVTRRVGRQNAWKQISRTSSFVYVYCGKYQVVEGWRAEDSRWSATETRWYFKLLRLPGQAPLIPQQMAIFDRKESRQRELDAFNATWKAYAQTLQQDCSTPCEQCNPHSGSGIDAQHDAELDAYELCDVCGMSDEQAIVAECGCCQQSNKKTVACLSCIPLENLMWLRAGAEPRHWRCKRCRAAGEQPVISVVFEDTHEYAEGSVPIQPAVPTQQAAPAPLVRTRQATKAETVKQPQQPQQHPVGIEQRAASQASTHNKASAAPSDIIIYISDSSDSEACLTSHEPGGRRQPQANARAAKAPRLSKTSSSSARHRTQVQPTGQAPSHTHVSASARQTVAEAVQDSFLQAPAAQTRTTPGTPARDMSAPLTAGTTCTAVSTPVGLHANAPQAPQSADLQASAALDCPPTHAIHPFFATVKKEGNLQSAAVPHPAVVPAASAAPLTASSSVLATALPAARSTAPAASPSSMQMHQTPSQQQGLSQSGAAAQRPTTIADLLSTANAMLKPELQITQAQGSQLEKAVGGIDVLLDLLQENYLNEVLQTDGKLGSMQLVAMRRVLNRLSH